MKSRLLFITAIILSFGMLYACAPEEPETERDQVLETLNDAGEHAWLLGHVQESEGDASVRFVPDPSEAR